MVFREYYLYLGETKGTLFVQNRTANVINKKEHNKAMNVEFIKNLLRNDDDILLSRRSAGQMTHCATLKHTEALRLPFKPE